MGQGVKGSSSFFQERTSEAATANTNQTRETRKKTKVTTARFINTSFQELWPLKLYVDVKPKTEPASSRNRRPGRNESREDG